MKQPDFILRYWAIPFFFLLANQASGQQIFKRSISQLEGLPAQTIYDLMTDQKGYIYLGTDNGLFKYNGSQFNSIPVVGNNSNSITALQQDMHGTIWGMNFSRQVFRMDNDSLKLFKGFDHLYEDIEVITDLHVDRHSVYALSNNTVFVHNITSDSSFKLVDSSSNHQSTLSTFNKSPDGSIYLQGSENHYYHLTEGKLHKEVLPKHLWDVPYKLVTAWGKQWAVLIKGHKIELTEFPLSNQTYSVNPVLRGYIFHTRSINDEPFLCTNEGLYRITKEGENFQLRPIVNDDVVSDVIQDYEGGYWASTLEGGLLYVPLFGMRLIPSPAKGEIFSRLISRNERTILAGTSRGRLYEFCPEGSLIYDFGENFGPNVEVIEKSVDGTIYFDNGFLKPGSKTITKTADIGKGIAFDKFGNAATATGFGTFYISIDSKSIKNRDSLNAFISAHKELDYSEQDAILLNGSRCFSVVFNPIENCFYSANANGLHCYYLSGDHRKILIEKSDVFSNSLQVSPQGEVWATTLQRGVIRINQGTIRDVYTTENGLSNNICKRLRIADNGEIWVINQQGIDIINPENGSIRKLPQTNWKTNLQINDLLVSGSKIYLLTQEGIVFFDRNDSIDISPPRIYVNSLIVNGRNKIKPNIRLGHDENNISVHFEGLCYNSKGSFSYKYRLLGFDTIWQQVKSPQNSANFSSLPPGEYVFQVFAKTHSGLQSLNPATLSFSISPPFWKFWWFISFEILLAILILGYLFTQIQENWRKKEKKRIERNLLSVPEDEPKYISGIRWIAKYIQQLIKTPTKTENAEMSADLQRIASLLQALAAEHNPEENRQNILSGLLNTIEPAHTIQYDDNSFRKLKAPIPQLWFVIKALHGLSSDKPHRSTIALYTDEDENLIWILSGQAYKEANVAQKLEKIFDDPSHFEKQRFRIQSSVLINPKTQVFTITFR